MSMLTRQVDRLRETADEVKRIKDNGVGWLWCDAITLDEAVKEMREAADTIENLRNRLTETCELEINTDMTAIKCDKCGYVVPKGANLMSVRYCAGCGRKVIE